MKSIHEIPEFLNEHTDTAITGVQGVVLLALGVWLSFWPDTFTQSLNIIAICLVGLNLLGDIFAAIGGFFKGLRVFIPRALEVIVTAIILSVLVFYPRFVFMAFPLLVGLYALLLATTHLIVFLQYRKEHSTKPLRQGFFSVICFLFGFSCLGALAAHIDVSLTLIGIYFILYALTLLADFSLCFVPRAKKEHLKRRVRFHLPVFVTALVPHKALTQINTFFEAQPSAEKKQLNSEKRERGHANVEVFVHVAPDGFGSMGHVDLCIEGKCISYGGYDEAAMKLAGGIGPGVLFEHSNKDAYIDFCKKQSNKTLFSFGLCLSDDEIKLINEKLTTIKGNAYEWLPEAHKAEIAGERGEFKDYGSLLYMKTGAKFYKFNSGSFKYYFVLGTNCVKLADTLLGASGADAVACGIIAPGTYYDFLNREYTMDGGSVVSRVIY